MVIGASSTPQPMRQDDSGLIRYRNESEMWDQLASVLYYDETGSVLVLMPVKGRIEIHASATMSGAGSLSISVNGAIVHTIVVPAAGYAQCFYAFDALNGSNQIALTGSVAITNPQIMARRGRRSTG